MTDDGNFELERRREVAKDDFWEFEQQGAQEARRLTIEKLHQFFDTYEQSKTPSQLKILHSHMKWPPPVYDDDISMRSFFDIGDDDVVPTKSIVLIPNPFLKQRIGTEKLKVTIPLNSEEELTDNVIVTDFSTDGSFKKYVMNNTGIWQWLSAENCRQAGMDYDHQEEGLYIDVDLFKIDEIARDEELPTPSIEITRYLSRKIHYWTGSAQRVVRSSGDDTFFSDI